MRSDQLVRALTIWSGMLDGRSRPLEAFRYTAMSDKTIRRTLDALERVPLFQVTHRWIEGKKLWRSDYKGKYLPIAPLTKRCCVCLKSKDIDEFHKDRLKPDGRVPTCKPCRKVENAVYRKKKPVWKLRAYWRERKRAQQNYD